MNIQELLNVCLHIIHTFGPKNKLSECEFMAYEQACMSIEIILKKFRETWETTDEPEDIKG